MTQLLRGRILALLGLLGILTVLMVGYGAITPRSILGHYPGGGQLTVHPEAYAGDNVQVTGEVTQTDPVVLTDDYQTWVGDHYRTGTFHLIVTNLNPTVRIG